ncbi:MAG TPA: transcriptional regulator, partial [Desulfosporosinus sp.]|nr:transcriptional regulator [Desulfosporosinus sp.]
MFEKYLDKVSQVSLFQGIERDAILAMLNCLKPKVC